MIAQKPRTILLVISAPSGAGKTTVCNRLLATTSGLARVVTCTTRPPRTGERDGVDYNFLKPAVFEKKLSAGDFLEHASVYGHSYGTPRHEVLRLLRSGTDVLVALDVQGAATMRALAAKDPFLREALVTVFITPPSIDELEARLRGRAQDTVEAIARRVQTARSEIRVWSSFDYLVISATMENDLRRVRTIYLAEKMRVVRCKTRQDTM